MIQQTGRCRARAVDLEHNYVTTARRIILILVIYHSDASTRGGRSPVTAQSRAPTAERWRTTRREPSASKPQAIRLARCRMAGSTIASSEYEATARDFARTVKLPIPSENGGRAAVRCQPVAATAPAQRMAMRAIFHGLHSMTFPWPRRYCSKSQFS